MKGIYIIINNFNGNSYIGLTNNINRRFKEHKLVNKNTVLCSAFKKYGVGNFSFVLLEELFDNNDLAEKEIYWINLIKPIYNMNKGGLGNLGRSLSNDEKENLRQKGKSQWASNTYKQKCVIISKNLKGRPNGYSQTECTKLKLREANLGKKQSLKTKNKRSLAMKISMIGNSNGNKKVIKLNINKKYLLTYNSIKEASIDVNIDSSGIVNVLKGRQNTSGGFYWIYKL